MTPDAEDIFRKVLAVFREFLKDCDHDLEGCDDLAEVEHAVQTARTLRQRVVAHVVEGADPRRSLEACSHEFEEICSYCGTSKKETNKNDERRRDR